MSLEMKIFVGVAVFIVIAFALLVTLAVRHENKQRVARDLREREEKERWKEEKRVQELALLERAEAGEVESLSELRKWRKEHHHWFSEEFEERAESILREREWRAIEKSVKELFVRSQDDASATVERLEALGELLAGLERVNFSANKDRLLVDLGTSEEELKAQLEALVKERYGELGQRAAGEREVFLQLRDLIDRTRRTSRWGTNDYGAVLGGDLYPLLYRPSMVGLEEQGLPRPKEWNEWVGRFLANPFLHDFEDPPEPEIGELELWAAEAIRAEDITLAKIVRAYCHYGKLQSQVASELRAGLAAFVDRRNTALGLVAEAEIATEEG